MAHQIAFYFTTYHSTETFKVTTEGYITQYQNDDFSKQWLFLGVSKHHWRRGIDLKFCDIIKQDTLNNIHKCYIWDEDHGAVRRWGRKIRSAWKNNA